MPKVDPTKKKKPLSFTPSSKDIEKAEIKAKKKTSSSNKGKKGSWKQGYFIPTNPDKCLNSNCETDGVCYRSGWERKFMIWCDTHPSIESWGGEVLKIPYFNPFKNRMANYIPDILMKYKDKDGKEIVDLIEIKPLKETSLSECKSRYDKVMFTLNKHKWVAAKKFCDEHGMNFKIVTEKEIFGKN